MKERATSKNGQIFMPNKEHVNSRTQYLLIQNDSMTLVEDVTEKSLESCLSIPRHIIRRLEWISRRNRRIRPVLLNVELVFQEGG